MLGKLDFLDALNNDKINPSTMILYSKKLPARELSQKFVNQVIRQVNEKDIIEK